MTAKSPPSAEPFIDVDKLAAHLSIAVKTVYKWAEAGILPHYKISPRALRFKLSECEAAMQKRRVRSLAEAREGARN